LGRYSDIGIMKRTGITVLKRMAKGAKRDV